MIVWPNIVHALHLATKPIYTLHDRAGTFASLLRYSPVTTSHMRNLSRVVPRVIQREDKICHA